MGEPKSGIVISQALNRCEICYKSIEDEEKRYFCNNCGNDFHDLCIGIAIKSKNQCPHCKQAFIDRTIKDYQAALEKKNPTNTNIPTEQENIQNPSFLINFISYELMMLGFIFLPISGILRAVGVVRLFNIVIFIFLTVVVFVLARINSSERAINGQMEDTITDLVVEDETELTM